MANARAIIVIALLVVLAVTLFGVFYGLRSSDGSIRSVSEFTATAKIDDGYWSYTFKVYSKVLADSNNQLSSWILEGQADYEENGVLYRHIYKNGNKYFGHLNGDGSFNVTGCQLVDQNQILQLGVNSFLPTQITDPKDVPAAGVACTGCSVYNLAIADESFTMFSRDGVPKLLLAHGKTIEVTSWTPDQQTFTVGDIPLAWAELGCVAVVGPNSFNQLDNFTWANDPNSAPSSFLAPQVSGHDTSIDLSMVHPDARNHYHKTEPESLPPLDPSKFVPLSNPQYFASRHELKLLGRDVTLVNRIRSGAKIAGVDSKAVLQAAGHSESDASVTVSGFCPSNWVGDGYCDSGCNDGSFNWDGGDCCPGTCLAGGARRYSCGIVGYDCKAGQNKHCLLLHGAGVGGPRPATFGGNPPGSYSTKYWGNIEYECTGLCNGVTYSYTDTTNYGWADFQLQNDYYNKAYEVYSQGGVVIGHSMANLILAGACYLQGKCGVRWNWNGGPGRGSKAAVVEANIYGFFGAKTSGSHKSLSYYFRGMMWGSDSERLAAVAGSRGLVHNMICGSSGWGSGGTAGFLLMLAKTFVWGDWKCVKSWWIFCYSWEWINADGLVADYECQNYNSGGLRWMNGVGIGGDSGGQSYMCDGNHLDLTGARGNHCNVFNWFRRAVRSR